MKAVNWKLKTLAALCLIASAKSSGDTTTYPQSDFFGDMINPNISPLRPVGANFIEIQELLDTASYVNQQRANAEAAVTNIQNMIPNAIADASSAIVPPAGYTDSFKIDLTEASGYYNQAALEIVQADYYTARDLLEDTYDEAKDELDAQIALFVASASEISKLEAMYKQALASETIEQREAIQQYIRTSDVQLTESTVTLYNESLDRLEDSAQLAGAALFLSQDPVALGLINTDAIQGLNDMSSAEVLYDAWSDTLTVQWNNSIEDTQLQGFFFNNAEQEITWSSVTPEYDGFYEDIPTMGSLFSSYSYGQGEAIAATTIGYDPNAKLYDAAQLQLDLIAISNTGVTELSSQSGSLGGVAVEGANGP